jgi:transmembrane sensor
MDNKRFSKLLRRFRMGEATEAERALVEQWYDLLDEQNNSNIEIDEDAMEARIWKKLESNLHSKNVSKRERRKGLLRKIKTPFSVLAAAVVLGLVIWLGGFFPETNSRNTFAISNLPEDQFDIFRNELSVVRKIQLSDLSEVILSPGATLKVPRRFSALRREVFLEGEAFFDITKNPRHPFYVYSGSVTTHVLGTSFTIKPLDNGDKIEVAVHTGRVEVFETNLQHTRKDLAIKGNGLVLTPNQRMVYYKETGVFETGVVAVPLPLSMEDQPIKQPTEFKFTETPLQNVLESLELCYGIEILVENKSLNNCPFTGDISGQNLYQKLELINIALGTTYEVKGTRVLIKGNGCD